jgi:hypothetical protein
VAVNTTDMPIDTEDVPVPARPGLGQDILYTFVRLERAGA